jgi:hypothetical protein
MTATAGFVGFGSTVSWNGTLIAHCKDIPFPNMTRDKVDFSNMDSDDQFEEIKAGWGHAGEVPFDVIFIPGDAGQAAAIADFLSGTVREMIITGPTAAAFTWTCNAYITGISGSMPTGDGIVMNLTLSLTGKPVLAVTTSANITSLTGIEENAGGALDFVPNFAGATITYNVLVNTASTWVKLTVTDATATITVTALGVSSTLVSGVQSGAIVIGAADTMTAVTVKVQDSNKVAKTYTINVARP